MYSCLTSRFETNRMTTTIFVSEWTDFVLFTGKRDRVEYLESKRNPLKTKRKLLYLKTQFLPRSKTFHLGYKNQSVYAVSGTSRSLFSDKYKTHKYSVGRTYGCWMLNCWCITWPVGFKRLKCWCITWPVGFKRLISSCIIVFRTNVSIFCLCIPALCCSLYIIAFLK